MNIKNGLEKTKEFGKKHWKELLAGCALVGAGVGCYVMCKDWKLKPTTNYLDNLEIDNANFLADEKERIAKVGWELGKMESLWDEGDNCVMTIINDVQVSDMGKFGEELLKIEGITPESSTSMIMSAIKDVNDTTQY